MVDPAFWLWASAGRALRGAALVASIGIALGACGAPPPPPPPDVPASFPAAALMTVDSASGQLHIEVRSAPEPLVRGQNVAQLVITDQSGNPVDGLTLTLVPWMPSHGHGTSVAPAIDQTDVGVFVANPLYLYMPGQWQLRMTFEGAFSDSATATVVIL